MAAPFKGPLDYIDVATRIVGFRTQYPTGSLQQQSLEFVKDIGGKDWVVFTAAAYRTPEDARPGVGTAWEPIPGATSFTRDSEVQNAETAAWGRAMVAALAVDTKKGIASSEEVRNRQEQAKPAASPPEGWRSRVADAKDMSDLSEIHAQAVAEGWATPDLMSALTAKKAQL